MRHTKVVLDLQFGSTGKGQVAGTLGRLWGADTAVCANMPNAGHTYRWTEYNFDNVAIQFKVIYTVMPVCAVLPSVRSIMIGPGAVIDLDKLADEIHESQQWLRGKTLYLHPNAAIVTQAHRDRETQLIRVGSTMKGSAEAVIDKMRRTGDGIVHTEQLLVNEKLHRICKDTGLEYYTTQHAYNQAIDSAERTMVEGAQGAGLSIHSHFWPYTTSRDVSLAQVWADCRLPATYLSKAHVIGVCRTFPIRVANRFKDGEQVGTSGGCYSDQHEIHWADLGRQPELTTVTRLPRRIFSFSTEQIIDAVRYCNPAEIALTFCDYLDTRSSHVGSMVISENVRSLMRRIEAASGRAVNYQSYGPIDTDMYACSGTYLKNNLAVRGGEWKQ